MRSKLWTLAAAAVVVGAVLVALFRASASDRLVFSPADKVCQLTGKFDKQYGYPGKPTHEINSNVTGTDYGYPVVWNNKLFFLFGDTRSIDPDDTDQGHALTEIGKGWDSVANDVPTTRPPSENCPSIQFITDEAGQFRPIKLKQIQVPPRPGCPGHSEQNSNTRLAWTPASWVWRQTSMQSFG